MKKLLATLLTIAMVLSMVVLPANAVLVDGTGTLTITPSFTSAKAGSEAVEVTYTIKVTPPKGKDVGYFGFTLNPPAEMTLPTAFKVDGVSVIAYIDKDAMLYSTEEETGIFETFSYTPASGVFLAAGTTPTRMMTAEATVLTIKATIAAGTTGSFTLGATNFKIGLNGTDTYTPQVETTPVVVYSEITGAQTVAVTAPAKGETPQDTIANATGYTGAITWNGNPSTFVASTAYTANVVLTAKTGYKFASGATAAVSGATIGNRVVADDGSTLTFDAVFPATDAKTITGLEITGYTGGAKTDGDTIAESELTVKATFDDSSMETNYSDYEVVYNSGSALKKGDTSFKVKKNTVQSAAYTITAVAGKTPTDALFTFTAPTLTYTGADQIASIKGAATANGTDATRGTVAYTVKKGGSIVTEAKNAGTYTLLASVAGGTEYDDASDIELGTVTISPKALMKTDFTMGTNPAYTGSEISAPVTTSLTATTDYTVSGTDKLTDVAASDVTVTFNGAGNYSGSVSKTWNLTKATLTLPSAGVTAKTYDGTTTATITPGTLSGIKGSDAVSVQETSITGAFADQYVGTGKSVTTTNSFTLTGAKAGNYTLTQPSALSGAITAATQTLTKVKDLKVVKGGTLTAAQLKEAVSGAQGDLTFTGAATAGSVSGNVFTAAAATTGDVTITATAADKDLNSDSTPEYAADTTGVIFKITVVDKQTAALTGGVSQTGCTFGQTLVDPVYTAPAGTNNTTITYAGTLRKGGSYGPSSTKPAEAGDYTVTVKCETATHIYSATSPAFAIAPKDITDAVVTLGTALTYTGSSQTQSVTKVELSSTDITGDCDVSGNSQTNAGAYTLTVTAKDASNYTGSAEKAFTVQKKAITPTVAITGTYLFTGSAITPTYTVKDGTTDLVSTDYSAATGANTNAGTNAGSLKITATANGNYSFTEVTKNFDIGKAGARTIADQTVSQKFSVTTEQSKSVAGLMPTNAGTLTYGKGSESKTGSVSVSSWSVDTDGLVKFTLTGGATGDAVTLPVIVTSTNYADSTINVAITLTAKDAQNTLTVTNGTTVTYGQTLALTASGGSGTGAVTFEIVSGGTGAATIVGSTLTPTTAGTVKVKAAKAADADYNEAVSAIVEITINKANPTGAPSYTAISAANKTLADAALVLGTITPAGTIKWVNDTGADLPAATVVTANTSYKWLFTPTDSANYNAITGNVTLYSVSTGGGGGVSTYPVTVTAATGGTITVSPEDASRGTIVTVTIKTDEGYTLDTLSATDRSGKTVELTKKSDDAYTFMMPGSGVTVAGTFKKAESPVNPFIDVTEPDWFYDDVMFTFVNGMMQGVSDDLFDVHGSTTRGMIVTVLYRMENEPDAVGNPFDDVENDKYYARAVAWAAANKIVNGYGPGRFGPEDHVTREQVATILYNYAVYKGYDVSVGENTNILSFKDALDIHDWAMPAMQWACGTGLIRGYDGYLTPRGNAERCQIAAIFHRFCDVVQ